MVQNITNGILNVTGLSELGVAPSDIANSLSATGTILDVVAGGVDVLAVSTVAVVTAIGAELGGPEISYPVGELLARPLLQLGNILATEATICTAGSELLSGDLGLEASIQVGTEGLSAEGELSIGTGTAVGAITTGVGWIPAVPSWGSLALQSIAIANDVGVLFEDASWKIPFSFSSGQNSYDIYLPVVPKEE